MKAVEWIKRVGWALIVIAAPSAQAGGGGLIPVRIGGNVDLDGDGDLDAFDIDPFVVCLTTGQCECP